MRIRKAEQSDSPFYYVCRVHPRAKMNSRITGDIDIDQHIEWFANSMKMDSRTMYVGTVDNKRVGHVRFDREGREADVSILVNPRLYGLGYGTTLLKESIDRYLEEEREVKRLVANIRPSNKASLRIFEKMGFVPIGKDPSDRGFICHWRDVEPDFYFDL